MIHYLQDLSCCFFAYLYLPYIYTLTLKDLASQKRKGEKEKGKRKEGGKSGAEMIYMHCMMIPKKYIVFLFIIKKTNKTT